MWECSFETICVSADLCSKLSLVFCLWAKITSFGLGRIRIFFLMAIINFIFKYEHYFYETKVTKSIEINFKNSNQNSPGPVCHYIHVWLLLGNRTVLEGNGNFLCDLLQNIQVFALLWLTKPKRPRTPLHHIQNIHQDYLQCLKRKESRYFNSYFNVFSLRT